MKTLPQAQFSSTRPDHVLAPVVECAHTAASSQNISVSVLSAYPRAGFLATT
jgi:hypothetical protein